MKRIFSLALALIFAFGIVPAATPSAVAAPPSGSIIQDPNFYAAVLEILGKDNGYAITAADVAGITRLDVSGKNIASLEGIEHFTSLKHLDCSNNRLTELDLHTTPARYAVVTAARLDTHYDVFNPGSQTDRVRVMFEDGTTGEYIIDGIMNINGERMTRVANGNITAAGQYGPVRDKTNNNGTPQFGDYIFYRSNTVGTSGNNSSIFAAAANIEDHLFSYTINGSRITLRELPVRADIATPDGNSRVSTVTTRFDQTWGTNVLGSVTGNNTRGLHNTDRSSVIIKSLDRNGNTVYRVYNKQSVPGLNVPQDATVRTETLRQGISSWEADPDNGPVARMVFVDATQAYINNVGGWAIVLETGYDNVGEVGTTGSVRTLTSNGEQILKTVSYDIRGYNALRKLRRGDVFSYRAYDNEPDRMFDIAPMRAMALIKGIDNNGCFNIVDANGNPLGGAEPVYVGSDWIHNYVLGGNGLDDNGQGPISISELRDAIGETDVYNLYRINWYNYGANLLVRMSIGASNANDPEVRYNNNGDRRDIAGLLAQAVEIMETYPVRAPATDFTEETAKQAIVEHINASSFRCVTDVTINNVTIHNAGGLAAGTATASVSPFNISCFERTIIYEIVSLPIPNAASASASSLALSPILFATNDTGTEKIPMQLEYLDVRRNYLPDESAVKGFAGTWDNVNFFFSPQLQITPPSPSPQDPPSTPPTPSSPSPSPSQPDDSTIVIEAAEDGSATLTNNQLNQIRQGRLALEVSFKDEGGDALGTIAFSAEAAGRMISDAQGGAVTVSLKTVDIDDLDVSGLTEEAAEALADRPVYQFAVTDRNGNSITQFGGNVTITLPYTLAAGENPNAIVVYYLTAGGIEIVHGYYDAASQTVIIKTNHFSMYAIGYNPVAFPDVPDDHLNKSAIDFVAAREITSGMGGDRFDPDGSLTRAQLLVMIMKAY
ncbi:MAG: S-layer homology domain-containing protein, partial [Oscillospiraceae bacterium]|nr:S-layer homology domain-containing protein [Oscillospiraceae bacterium]